jgi:hypothetical protein
MNILKIAFVAIAYFFVGGYTSKPLSSVTYHYISGTPYQRLDWGHTTETDLCERTIICSYFTDVNNWTTSTQSYTVTSDYSKYIGAVSFDEEATADGGTDGQLTLHEALSGVCVAYTSNQAMSSTYIIDGFAVVTITAATACH